MMFSCKTFFLKRRRAFSTVSPSCSVTSANCHLHPAPSFPLALWGHFRRRSRLALSQLFRQFLAGLEARTPFCGDGDGLPGARVAALALLPVFHDEAAKSAQVHPLVCLERFRDQVQDRVHCHLHPAPSFPLALWGHFRRRSRLAVLQRYISQLPPPS